MEFRSGVRGSVCFRHQSDVDYFPLTASHTVNCNKMKSYATTEQLLQELVQYRTFRTLFTAWCFCELQLGSSDSWDVEIHQHRRQTFLLFIPSYFLYVFFFFLFEKAVIEAGKSPTEANLTEFTSDRKSIRPCVWNMTEKKELTIEEMRTKWKIRPRQYRSVQRGTFR